MPAGRAQLTRKLPPERSRVAGHGGHQRGTLADRRDRQGARGTGPDAFGCSRLTMMAYRAAGISIPRTSEEQRTFGQQIPASQVQPRDLVFFAGPDGTMRAPGHLGIVIGSGTMIDAPCTGVDIREDSYTNTSDLVRFTGLAHETSAVGSH